METFEYWDNFFEECTESQYFEKNVASERNIMAPISQHIKFVKTLRIQDQIPRNVPSRHRTVILFQYYLF